jgi:hypothetical protein
MSPRSAVLGLTLLAACTGTGGAGGGAAGVGSGAAPVPPAPAPAPAPPQSPAYRPRSTIVRYGPSLVRYVVTRRLHVEQTFGGQQHVQDVGGQFFLTLIVSEPADSGGYPATFTVDSIVPDSGTPEPVAAGMANVHGLAFTGRLAPGGAFQGAAADTTSDRAVAQLLGNFRDFLPRIPPDGVKLGAQWTDSVTLAQRTASADVSRHGLVHSHATNWEEYAGVGSLRIESQAAYTVSGSGQNGGQSFAVSGAGAATTTSFLAEDGRYVGGESRDSTNLTISLPMQQLSIPVVQVVHSAVTALP